LATGFRAGPAGAGEPEFHLGVGRCRVHVV
jgi:hypothetical protein